MILLIDNFDSFIYNIAHYVRRVGVPVEVVRNDAITIKDIYKSKPQAIILSPGPCGPKEAGICLDVVRHFYTSIPILGVCLGHQVIGQAMGGAIVKAIKPVHGKVSKIWHNSRDIFFSIDNPTVVTRYHSLVVSVDRAKDLSVTAKTQRGEVMAFSHKQHPVYGVQFHPEAFLTNFGYKMIRNFINIVKFGSAGTIDS